MNKLKVPDSIKLGGHKYKIILDYSKKLIDEGSNGEVNYRKQEIRINATRPNSQKREALIHEILHCVNKVYDGETSEEKTITRLSEGLNQVFDELGIEFKWRDIRKK